MLARAVDVPHPLVPRDFDFTAHEHLTPSSVPISARITVIAGLNGAGKTKVLKALSQELGQDGRLIEVHALTSWLRSDLADRRDLGELADESEDLVVDERVLDGVRQIVRRDYASIRWYALPLADSPFEELIGEAVIPYFVVDFGGAEYSMLDMGAGELACHVLLWLIWYLRDAEGIALLLDEPDAFLPPDSREVLLDHLATMSLRQKQAIVVATHSAELIEPAAQHPGALLFLLRDGAGAKCYSAQEDVAGMAREYLYKDPRIRLLAFVEDPAAAALATELLKAIDPLIFRMTALYWGKGVGGLEALADHLPRPARPPRGLEFVIVADADQPELLEKNNEDRWPIVLLPGDGREPDRLFMEAAYAEPGRLALGLGKAEPAMHAVLERIRGAEAHEWTDALVASADVDRTVALRALAVNCVHGLGGGDLVATFEAGLRASGLTTFSS